VQRCKKIINPITNIDTINTRNNLDIIEFINFLRPDILFFQEYSPYYIEDNDNLKLSNFLLEYNKKFSSNEYKYFTTSNCISPQDKHVYLGNFIMSKNIINETTLHTYEVQKKDNRCFIESKIKINDIDIVVVNIHPESENNNNYNKDQIFHIFNLISTKYNINDIPIIIAGDFNTNNEEIHNTIIDKGFISVHKIYDNNREKIKSFVMYVNCSHFKGIKFIREDLKFFSKTHIHSDGGNVFKCIILLNADKLTMDAQSALRRCIELFSHNTRFFIVAENKNILMKPILSRFCEIYIPEPIYQGKCIHLYKYNLDKIFSLKEHKTQRIDQLKKEFIKNMNDKLCQTKLCLFVTKLYEKGYSGLDILFLLENTLLERAGRPNLTKKSNKKRSKILNNSRILEF
jgi:endonuclease/exonuclease/phosphatase family metal-dependent hydrolase